MSSENIGILFTLIVCSILLSLSVYVSTYFYLISIPGLIFFAYALLESLAPSLHKSLFKKENKKILSPDGENLIYFDKVSDGVSVKFDKKNDVLNGTFYSYYAGGTVKIKANFIDGRINGKCTDFSITAGINSIEELYDMGSLLHKKVYLIGVDRGKLHNEEKYEKSQNAGGIIQGEIESIIKKHKL
ncbi:hypothetical protein N8301_00865 [Cyclobacteriaceae bacterium]|nr:hypothetical protein [Cyclobacteriaceae bacterium]